MHELLAYSAQYDINKSTTRSSLKDIKSFHDMDIMDYTSYIHHLWIAWIIHNYGSHGL